MSSNNFLPVFFAQRGKVTSLNPAQNHAAMLEVYLIRTANGFTMRKSDSSYDELFD